MIIENNIKAFQIRKKNETDIYYKKIYSISIDQEQSKTNELNNKQNVFLYKDFKKFPTIKPSINWKSYKFRKIIYQNLEYFKLNFRRVLACYVFTLPKERNLESQILIYLFSVITLSINI